MWNWNASLNDCVYMDIETQSLCDLKKEGSRKYAEDPSTRISMAAFIKGERKTFWWLLGPRIDVPKGWEIHTGSEPPEWVLEHTFCAHNAGEFDKLVWDKCVGVDVKWIDSMPIARAAGLPGGLDKIGKVLLERGKNTSGYALINMLCVARVMSGQVVYPVCTPAAWSVFAEYCCQDVELLSEIFPLIHAHVRPDAMHLCQIINDRGIPIDVDFAARLVMLQEELKIRRSREVEQLSSAAERQVREMEDWMEAGVSMSDVRSVKKVIAWLQRIGIQPPMKNGKPTLERKALSQLFKEPESYMDTGEELDGAIAALKARLDVTRATAGKAKAALAVVNKDRRARGQFVYNGAHTGRLSGRGLQPHNFLRGANGINYDLCRADLTLAEIEAESQRLGSSMSDVLASFLRPMIAAKNITTADFGAIEARGVAWFCGDETELAVFRQLDADPYLPLASKIFGRPCTKKDELERWVAKQAILGCGYGMSWKKFTSYCAGYGVDLQANSIDAQSVVKAYRDSHRCITAGWQLVQQAAHAALSGEEQHACRCMFFVKQNCLHIQLPSGRCIVYRNPRIVLEVPGWATLYGIQAPPQPTLVFDHPHGDRGLLYGGRIMENIVQGGMYDVLIDALNRAERAGLNPFMTVHDEIVAETDELEQLVRIMSISPSWAQDLPILVEGWLYPRYVKTPPAGCTKAKALSGEVHVSTA